MTDGGETTAQPGSVGLPWHRALTWAICGEDRTDLGLQDRPDLDRLTRELSEQAGLRSLVRARQARKQPWPFPVPTDLMAGLGPAQFAAAVTGLRDRLDLERPEAGAAPPVLSSRALDADERRLLQDVPPHHGAV